MAGTWSGSGARTATHLPPGPPVHRIVQAVLYPHRHRVIPWLRGRYGDIFTVSLLGRPAVQLCTPELNHAVFTGSVATFHAGAGNQVLRAIMGEHSVLTTDEDEHRRIRKLLMPPFHGAPLRGYRAMIIELAEAEVVRWTIGVPFPAHERMNALTLEVILRVVFGVSDGPRLDELRTAITRLVTAPLPVFLGEIAPPLRRFGPWRRFRQLVARIDELLHAEIDERRKDPQVGDRSDVLSQLVTAQIDGDRLTDSELRDQMMTLLLAGHETTATTLAWTLHELAHNIALHDAVTAAASRGDDDYLEAVVKESMRRHPVIYSVGRTLTKDVELGGYRIPAGYTVMPGIGPVHADPAHHEQPDAFRPERFLDGSASPSTWLPFGGGARRCPGAGFALLEAVAVLRQIVLRYRITPASPQRETTRARHITLVPSDGCRVVVQRRRDHDGLDAEAQPNTTAIARQVGAPQTGAR